VILSSIFFISKSHCHEELVGDSSTISSLPQN
jgi:hypothetical protein